MRTVSQHVGKRRPEEIMAGLPPAVRVALEQQDKAALMAALMELDDQTRQQAIADLAALGVVVVQITGIDR